jgi:hypothetical protein
MWVEGGAFLEDQQGFIVPAFIVELMGLFVEVVGAEKGIRHPVGLPKGLGKHMNWLGLKQVPKVSYQLRGSSRMSRAIGSRRS